MKAVKGGEGTPSTSLPLHQPWPSCGYHLLHHSSCERLQLTEDWLRHLWQRPELAPVSDSCPAERALHAALLEAPTTPVSPRQLVALADPDARDNYRLALALRALIRSHDTLEEAYSALVGGRWPHPLPSAAADMLAQPLLRHALRAQDVPFTFRAAELFFRNQRAHLEHGVVLADQRYLDQRRSDSSPPLLQQLIREAQGSPRADQPQLEVIDPDNAVGYLSRAEHHDLALDLALKGPGMMGLCTALAAWIEHFHGGAPAVTALQRIDDPDWRWHVGLDPASSELLNQLYAGSDPDPEAAARLLALFRLEFANPEVVQPAMRNKPIYLGLAMAADGVVRLKPQNLLYNLPMLRQP